MPLTLRQVIDQIKAVANAHAQIDGVGVGDFAELQSQTREYPLFWIFHERSDIAEGYIIRRIRLLCADRVQTGQEGDDDDGMEIEVLSDTQRILMDFIAYFAQQHDQAYMVERVGSIEPFTERFDDRVAGNTALLTFKEPWDYSKCETPISTVTFPPTVDGLTLYDFGDASVLGRLTAQQVADLQAAYGAVCIDATITINGAAYGTVPSGGTENIIVESENNNPLGSLVGGNWQVGNAHLRVNGTTVGNLEPEQWHDHYATINGTQAGAWHNPSQTWQMTVLQGGAPVGSLSGTDWVVPVCADATAVLKNTANTTLSTTSIASGASQNITAPDATAVLKNTANTTLLTEAIPSNVSENITAPDATITLNGSAYGSAPSGATFNVTTTPPSLSVASSSATPAYAASFTITATASGFTPTSYTFYYVNDVSGNRTSTTQAGSSLALTATWNGAQTIIVTAIDSVSGATATGSVSVTVSNGMRIPTWILNTAPPGSATGAITQVGDLFGFQNNGGNHGNCYAAGLTGACGIVWQPIGAIVNQFMGLSPNITYSGNQQQQLDPAWDWQVCGPLGNRQMFVQDNNSYVNLSTDSYSMYWWRMDRSSGGTIRLYRGTAPDQCNTLVHTFSLTNTGTLYPKFYDLSGMRYSRAYIYGS